MMEPLPKSRSNSEGKKKLNLLYQSLGEVDFSGLCAPVQGPM